MDGDLVFAAATGARPAPDMAAQLHMGHAAACTMARAIARGVHAARPMPADARPAWSARFGRDGRG
jgi:D-aminopeptidase